jgi:hypothetical protein
MRWQNQYAPGVCRTSLLATVVGIMDKGVSSISRHHRADGNQMS